MHLAAKAPIRRRPVSSTLGLMTAKPAVSLPIADIDRQALSVLYQVTAADIVFFKQQQWTAMNYAVGLDAALVASSTQVLKGSASAWAVWSLVLLACSIPLAALLALKRTRNSIEARRTRLEQTRSLLGPAFLEAWQVKKEEDDFYFLFLFVLAVTSTVTLWLVLQAQ